MMLQFCSLYSGSTGNSLFVQSEHTKILIDAGVSMKKINDALASIGVLASDLDAILVTHEHSDHVQGLGTLASKFHLPVFANTKTWDAMPKQRDKLESSNIKTFQLEECFEIGDLKILPFLIPHDAANPCGFNLFHENHKLSIATDLGHVTSNIMNKLEGSHFLMLESNYDPEVLKCSSYPFVLKSRIAGPNGHLSNHLAGKTIAHLIGCGLSNAVIGHLSKESNFADLAYQTVVNELSMSNYSTKDINLCVASRTEQTSLFDVDCSVSSNLHTAV